ncbi:hypothetical protein DBR28_12545, partial [Chryseobacterium sp. HMWF028]
ILTNALQKIYKKLFYRQKDHKYNFEQVTNIYQWLQSYLSILYVKHNGTPENEIQQVCDYITPAFSQNKQPIGKDLKSRKVLYNPKKRKKEI